MESTFIHPCGAYVRDVFTLDLSPFYFCLSRIPSLFLKNISCLILLVLYGGVGSYYFLTRYPFVCTTAIIHFYFMGTLTMILYIIYVVKDGS